VKPNANMVDEVEAPRPEIRRPVVEPGELAVKDLVLSRQVKAPAIAMALSFKLGRAVLSEPIDLPPHDASQISFVALHLRGTEDDASSNLWNSG